MRHDRLELRSGPIGLVSEGSRTSVAWAGSKNVGWTRSGLCGSGLWYSSALYLLPCLGKHQITQLAVHRIHELAVTDDAFAEPCIDAGAHSLQGVRDLRQ
jgi:hypothetical protein